MWIGRIGCIALHAPEITLVTTTFLDEETDRAMPIIYLVHIANGTGMQQRPVAGMCWNESTHTRSSRKAVCQCDRVRQGVDGWIRAV